MGKKPQNITITPKLIEFEDHILRVPNIATVTIGPDPKRRRIALILFVFSAVSFWLAYQTTQHFGAMMGLQSHSRTNTPGLVLTLLAICTLVIGLYLFRYLALFISTSDSRFTVLVDSESKFMREVMARIREALLAGEEGNVYYQVNVSAEKIERLDANATVVTNSAGATVAGGSIDQRAAADTSPTSATVADLLNKAREQVTPVAGKALQAASELANRSRAVAEERMAQLRQSRDPAHAGASGSVSANVVNVNAAAPGSIIAGGAMTITGSHVSTNGSVINDFDNLVQALARLQITHKDEIIEYIRPVRDHLAGGATPREDARTRWSWFAANVAATLTGVDGALAIIERVSRLLGLGR